MEEPIDKELMMRHLVLGMVLIVGAGALLFGVGRLGDEAEAKQQQQAAPELPMRFGSTVPSLKTEYLMSALVQLEGHLVPSNAFAYISHGTLNRLFQEAGRDPARISEGVAIQVRTGPAAVAWGLEANSVVSLVVMRSGVPVPATILAGDEWLAHGVRPPAAPSKQGR